ncbi:uncharacterized protein FFE2_13176 [Fusarium fujikuroi]|nr:uncharacterized protein FFE2_13176 [Fusarium fujikuroi]SCO19272.1 uncharacterized protein FFM5_12102 [Fusarium fujikuroi]SCV61449.1 uncharacterized protein FFFS_16019 [Fusarium fujikuroi]
MRGNGGVGLKVLLKLESGTVDFCIS